MKIQTYVETNKQKISVVLQSQKGPCCDRFLSPQATHEKLTLVSTKEYMEIEKGKGDSPGVHRALPIVLLTDQDMILQFVLCR